MNVRIAEPAIVHPSHSVRGGGGGGGGNIKKPKCKLGGTGGEKWMWAPP
jgi:hypothetical protein